VGSSPTIRTKQPGVRIMDNTPSFYLDNMGSIPVRRTIVLFVFALLFSVQATAKQHRKPQQALPAEPARAVLLFDRKTNTVKESLNLHEVMPIASVTKLMTAYVVLESHADLNEVITVSQQKIEGSRVLKAGMKLTRNELLHLALIASDNLAAKLLAVAHPRGYDAFINEMNAAAKQIGMTNTHYIEPTGLLLNTSTVWDLHLLNQTVAKYSIFSDAAMSKTSTQTAQTKKGLWQRLVIRNTSAFAGEYDIRVGKTGFTNPAGWCIDMLVRHNGHEFDLIVLGSPNKQARNKLVAAKLKGYMSSITANAVSDKIDQIDIPDYK
jgi:D-alanyl-D-alanine endopeptidase (penicillin-binding protein 7)